MVGKGWKKKLPAVAGDAPLAGVGVVGLGAAAVVGLGVTLGLGDAGLRVVVTGLGV